MSNNTFGMDLGTNNIKIYNKVEDSFFLEKNMIAIENKNTLLAYGDSAFDMYEKAPANIVTSYPVCNGVIADIQNMETLVKYFINDLSSGGIKPSDYYVAVPTDVTEVEKRAFYDVIMDAKVKAKKIVVVEKPIADAVGVGIDVNSPNGHLLVNIGADTTEITVLSMGGIVLSKLIKTGGMKLDESIASHIRKKYNLIIGSRSAEIVKKELADAMNEEPDKVTMTYGRNIVTGLPNAREITGDLVHEAISDLLHQIIENIKVILERTPPELSADIISRGIYLTGGSANVKNLCKLITKETGLKVNISDEPSESVIRGISKILTTPDLYDLAYVPREKQYD